MKRFRIHILFFLFSAFWASPASLALANNLVISNVTLEDRNASANTLVVQFDISWDHSWRKTDGRHDAAWVFFKIQDVSNGSDWYHAKPYTAGTNPTDTSPGSNPDVKIVVPSDKMGAFISRQATGNGTFSSKKVRMTIDYGTPGVPDVVLTQVQVHGIEMVYVPEGPFYVGESNNPYSFEAAYGTGGGAPDAILSIFNSNGSFQWAKRIGGGSANYIRDIAIDNSQNVSLVGEINDTGLGFDLNGDGDTMDTNETSGGVHGGYDVFLSVFNSIGTFQWAKVIGGTGDDYSYGSAVDSYRDIIVTGKINGNADINGDGDTADTAETAGGVNGAEDVFISDFDSSGTFLWAKRLGGLSSDYGYGLAVDSNNNIIVTGNVTGKADLNGDGDTADTNENGATGIYQGTDGFISVFNSSGTFQWSKRLGGTSSDVVNPVSVDSVNNIIVVGSITGNADLNGDGDTADTAETGGGIYSSTDAFVSVFNSGGTFQWAKRWGGTSGDGAYDLAVDSNNRIIAVGLVNGNTDLNGDGDTADSSETGGGVYTFNDPFVTVFNSSGTFQWAKRMGGGIDLCSAVAADSNNNIIVGGGVTGAADLNGDADTADTNENVGTIFGNSDSFISEFNSGGTFQWSKRLGGPNDDWTDNVMTNSNNDIAVGMNVGITADVNGDGQIVATHAFYQYSAINSAAQITTAGTLITAYYSFNEDIDVTPKTVTGLAGVTGNTSWPNGYSAFYAMKYEITQEQYVKFLNDLSRVQQGNRVGATVSGNTIANYYVMSNGVSVSARNGIRAPASGNGTTPTTVVFGNDFNANGTFNETDDGQTIAANWLNWPDLCAYADWAGLRPMTELEFEKLAHGPTSPTYSEYAWGNTTITQATSITNSGRGSEVAGNAGNGLATYGSHASVQGPLRTSFAATNATNRLAAGAGYYGAMELSGNATERAVTLGNSTGRAFTGTHGDGTLTTTASFEGNATNTDWPGINGTTNKGVTAGTGGGWRGGNWNDSTISSTNSSQYAWTADRNITTGGVTTRDNEGGGRCVRTAP
jgi:formylglycine-generating enzyme required for sulfatase activity